MDKRCMIEACKREAETHCYHCSQDVCSKHFLEHKNSIQEQLPTFVDEVNVVYDRLRRAAEKESDLVPVSLLAVLGRLEQWRVDCHQQIDLVYNHYRMEIDGIIQNCRQEDTQKSIKLLEYLEKIREQVKEMLKENDVTHRQLETLKRQLETIKQTEKEPVDYPDIHVTIEKLDVRNHIKIVNRPKASFVEQKRPRNLLNGYMQSLVIGGQRAADISASTDRLDQCPTCYLIFPVTMTAVDRNMHVNEHFE